MAKVVAYPAELCNAWALIVVASLEPPTFDQPCCSFELLAIPPRPHSLVEESAQSMGYVQPLGATRSNPHS
eukprot:11045423-Alexandrium_andersonii.AAC.1